MIGIGARLRGIPAVLLYRRVHQSVRSRSDRWGCRPRPLSGPAPSRNRQSSRVGDSRPRFRFDGTDLAFGGHRRPAGTRAFSPRGHHADISHWCDYRAWIPPDAGLFHTKRSLPGRFAATVDLLSPYLEWALALIPALALSLVIHLLQVAAQYFRLRPGPDNPFPVVSVMRPHDQHPGLGTADFQWPGLAGGNLRGAVRDGRSGQGRRRRAGSAVVRYHDFGGALRVGRIYRGANPG